jgi:hypothetical protein
MSQMKQYRFTVPAFVSFTIETDDIDNANAQAKAFTEELENGIGLDGTLGLDYLALYDSYWVSMNTKGSPTLEDIEVKDEDPDEDWDEDEEEEEDDL